MFLDYHLQEGFLFKNHQLRIPQSSMRLGIIFKELHGGGLGGHFGMDKSISLVRERYLCPSINKDVKKFVECCRVCKLEKCRS